MKKLRLLYVSGLSLLLTVGLPAYAQFGGGGSFSGGRSSGRSGGSSGGDGMDILFLIYLVIEYPIIGVPLVIILIIMGIFGAQKGQHYHQGRTISRGRQFQQVSHRESALAKITQVDAKFNEDLFLEHIRSAYQQLQNAWTQQNLDRVNHFISDSVQERCLINFSEQKKLDYKENVEDLQVFSPVIAHVQQTSQYDIITVKITAQMRVFRTSLSTGKKVSGDIIDGMFSEFWSFIRKTGVQTSDHSLFEHNCPNCGNQVELNQSEKCSACGALVKNGDYDWVLAEITQASEWHVKDDNQIKGVTALENRDPGFSVLHLEDRSSVMFWRLMKSYHEGKVSPIQKMATESFCEQLQPKFQKNNNGERMIPWNPAIGSVDTFGIISDKEGYDYALVQIHWSRKAAQVLKDGKVKPAIEAALQHEIYVLKRKHGVETNSDSAMSSAHCPSCGAPPGDSSTNSCDYCGTVLNTGSEDWVLDDIGFKYEEKIELLFRELETSQLPPVPGGISPATFIHEHKVASPRSQDIMVWMIHIMLSDGEIDNKEMDLIQDYALKSNIAQNQVEQFIQGVQNGHLEFRAPVDQEESRIWLEEMAAIALADGKISQEEKKAMLALGKKVGYTQYDIMHIINKKRKTIYQEVREAERRLRSQQKS
ncbi:MAG: TIM44-like domain-containing protein [Lentisphaeria bacterium]|nr:TIM44-like domain-containing protein [Lentisphaeria bacterium]